MLSATCWVTAILAICYSFRFLPDFVMVFCSKRLQSHYIVWFFVLLIRSNLRGRFVNSSTPVGRSVVSLSPEPLSWISLAKCSVIRWASSHSPFLCTAGETVKNLLRRDGLLGWWSMQSSMLARCFMSHVTSTNAQSYCFCCFAFGCNLYNCCGRSPCLLASCELSSQLNVRLSVWEEIKKSQK